MSDPDTRTELNRLYWDSDASVSEIADRLDISRRALYDGIVPQPAGAACPECGAPLEFRNRTALENREAECPECGHETRLDGVPRPAEPMAGPPEDGDGRARRPGERTAWGRAVRTTAEGSGPALGAAFIAGLAIGAMVTHLLNRR